MGACKGMGRIGLARAIEELRTELDAAQEAGAGAQLRFEIVEAELELQLELRKEGTGEGKLSFGVATAGGSGTSGSTQTHRLVLSLKVRDEALGGRNAEVAAHRSGSWDASSAADLRPERPPGTASAGSGARQAVSGQGGHGESETDGCGTKTRPWNV